jgi:hypothetical protein
LGGWVPTGVASQSGFEHGGELVALCWILLEGRDVVRSGRGRGKRAMGLTDEDSKLKSVGLNLIFC